MADNIGWDEAVPAETEVLGLGNDRIQSTKTSVRQVVGSEHNFPSTGGNNVGYHLFGSARPYYGTQSRVSSAGSFGRVMFASDTSQYFYAGSEGTSFIGGQRVISAFTLPSTLPQRHQWVESFGTGQTTAGSRATVVYDGSGFSGIPFIQVTPGAGPGDDVGTNLYAVTLVRSRTTDFQVSGWFMDAASTTTLQLSTGVPFTWRSLGSRAL